jgi:hypothetical protein
MPGRSSEAEPQCLAVGRVLLRDRGEVARPAGYGPASGEGARAGTAPRRGGGRAGGRAAARTARGGGCRPPRAPCCPPGRLPSQQAGPISAEGPLPAAPPGAPRSAPAPLPSPRHSARARGARARGRWAHQASALRGPCRRRFRVLRPKRPCSQPSRRASASPPCPGPVRPQSVGSAHARAPPGRRGERARLPQKQSPKP